MSHKIEITKEDLETLKKFTPFATDGTIFSKIKKIVSRIESEREKEGKMNIKIAREIAARIWCDQEMGKIEMDVGLAEEIAQLLVRHINIESERGEGEIGPDYLGQAETKYGNIAFEICNFDIEEFPHAKHLIREMKKTISTFLKGRMKVHRHNPYEMISEIKYIHERLCGEVGDE